MTVPSDLPSPSNVPAQPPLGAQTFRGSWISVGGQGAQLVVRLASTVVLARLLTPDAYGLTAMVTVVTGFVGLFKSLGLATATIQAPRLSERELSGLYWINALIGVVAMLLTLALAPAMSWFYAEPRVAPLMAGLSVTFLFGGFAVQPAALLRRRLQFASIAAIELAAVAVGAVTAVLLARAGAGPWALVAGVVSTELSNLVLVSVVVDWKPMRPSFNTSLGHLLGLGRDLTMFNVLNYWARNLDNFLIGRFWGAAELGLYGRAYQLLLLPLQQVTTPLAPVAIAALSRLQQDGPRFRSAYVRILEKVSIVCMPLTTFLFFNAREVVALVLGAKWLEVAPIFAALAAAAHRAADIGDVHLAARQPGAAAGIASVERRRFRAVRSRHRGWPQRRRRRCRGDIRSLRSVHPISSADVAHRAQGSGPRTARVPRSRPGHGDVCLRRRRQPAPAALCDCHRRDRSGCIPCYQLHGGCSHARGNALWPPGIQRRAAGRQSRLTSTCEPC